MNTKELKLYLEKNHKNIEVSNIKNIEKGVSNHNFLVICKTGEKYVVKVSKNRVMNGDGLYNEFIVLKFLEENNIGFTPRVILYDVKNKVLLLEFIDARNIKLDSLNDEQIKTLVEYIYKLKQLKYEDFLSFCKKNSYPILSDLRLIYEDFEEYTIKRFNFVVKNNKSKDLEPLIRYIASKINFYEEKFKRFKETNSISLEFGDVNDNFMADNSGKIYIIDWEFARFIYNYGGYHLWTQYFTKKEKKSLFEEIYFNTFSENREEVKKLLDLNMNAIRFNDIIWAMMRFVETNESCFLELAFKRQKIYMTKENIQNL